MSGSAGSEAGVGIAAWRYRTGVTLMALGGLVYIWATIRSSNPLFAVAVGLVGLGLLVHLSDPVVHGNRLTAVALALAAAAAFTDAALPASDYSGPATAVALVVLVAGVVLAAVSRKRAKAAPPAA